MGILDILLAKKPKKEELQKSQPITLSGEQSTDLEKAVKPKDVKEYLEGSLERSKAVFSLESKLNTGDQIYQKRGRLLDKELRELAHYDAVISLIVSTRANQVLPFGNRTRSKYDRGFLVRETIPVQNDPRIPDSEKESESVVRTQLIDAVTRWVVNCGTTNRNAVEFVFEGSDSTFKKCSYSEFLSAQARNLLIFGRCATQIIRNRDGIPIMFRPVAVETIYRVIPERDNLRLANDEDANEQAKKDILAYNEFSEKDRPMAYVQRIDGKDVSFFTEEELRIDYYQKQAYDGLDGYPLCPIEQAMYTISLHFHAQNYMNNSLTKGLGAKGIINLQTLEGGVVSKEDTDNFRKLFSNYVARNDNSATIPVISGPIKVEFTELNATVKDLEFLNLYARVIQILCASFQISPHEVGFGHLTTEKASAGDEGAKQDQIIQGEERGLRQLLDKVFNIAQEIVFEAFPQVKDVLMFEVIGLGQNTKEADLSLYKQELETSGTFAKIWADSERSENFPFGGDVPTSPIFHQNVAIYMKMAEMRHYFFKDKDALTNPAYDFFVFPAFNEAYQALKVQSVQMQQQMAQQQLQQGDLQTQMMNMQMQAPPEGGEGQDPATAQAEVAKVQAETEAKKQEMQLKREEQQMDMQMKEKENEQKLRFEREKHLQNLRLLSQKQNADAQVAQQGAQLKMQQAKQDTVIKQQQTQQQATMDRVSLKQKMDHQRQEQEMKQKQSQEQAMQQPGPGLQPQQHNPASLTHPKKPI